MIFNSSTSSHDIYQPDRRARKKRPEAIRPKSQGNPHGSLAEKCAWLKARQQKRGKP
jgi:hypothetical protein